MAHLKDKINLVTVPCDGPSSIMSSFRISKRSSYKDGDSHPASTPAIVT